MLAKIIEKQTGETIGSVVTNQTLTFGDACRLVGMKWKTYPDVDCDGWYKDGILWDESVAELDYN